MIDEDIRRYYGRGRERDRLFQDGDTLEFARVKELLQRYLPPAPADILDVGGGPGAYAAWLATAGYRVHLVDPIPLHIEQAGEASAAQPGHPFTVALGDARRLIEPDAAFNAVLCFGPLYHLTDRDERTAALREAHRVLRPGGLLLAQAISRFALLLDGVRHGYFAEDAAAEVITAGVRSGENRNPGLEQYPGWFTTSHLHLPADLSTEITQSGFHLDALLGVEGPGGFIGDGWENPAQRPSLLQAARLVEQEPSLLGLSAHLLAVAQKGN